MATEYLHRLLLAVPAASQSTFNAWWKNNVDPGGGDRTFSVGLSPTGAAPWTYFVACAALTAADLKKIVTRLCTLSGITLPANWDSLSRAERVAWVRSQLSRMMQQTGLRALLLDDNDGAWSDYAAALRAAGLAPAGV